MSDELKDQRIPIMMTPSEVKAIDDWMFTNRIKSRAEAIRRLCQLGIVVDSQTPQMDKGFIEFAKITERLDASYASLTGKNEIDAMELIQELTTHIKAYGELFRTLTDPIANIKSSVLTYRGNNIARDGDVLDAYAVLEIAKKYFEDLSLKIEKSKEMKPGRVSGG